MIVRKDRDRTNRQVSQDDWAVIVRTVEVVFLLLGLIGLPLLAGRMLAEPGVGRVLLILPRGHGIHSTDLLLLAVVGPVWVGIVWRLWRRLGV
jgi:hypothetical protein